MAWSAALGEGRKAVEAARAESDAKAKQDAENLARITNTPEIKASEAAAKAAEPYINSM